jgi:hypothetical protein
MKTAPRSPAELTAALLAIFPSLPRDFASSGESVISDADPTYHSVIREFAYFFAKNADQFSDRQLRRFAELVSRCTTTPGDLANAFDTCFLEHTVQLRVDARLHPFLAAAKRERR